MILCSLSQLLVDSDRVAVAVSLPNSYTKLPAILQNIKHFKYHLLRVDILPGTAKGVALERNTVTH